MVDASVGSEPVANPCETPTQKVKTKLLNLALQGGGAHDAFTWGVLDGCRGRSHRVRRHQRNQPGAMNATVLASGMATGGREGARRRSPVLAPNQSRGNEKSIAADPAGPLAWRSLKGAIPKFRLLRALDPLFLPYKFNPLNRNPLRQSRWTASISPR